MSVGRRLGRRGFAFESAAARVCREAGRRVTTNARVQDRDLLPLRQVDNRRLEVVVEGLLLFRGAQLAIHTIVVSPVRSDGTARRQSATTNGAALDQARRRKERTYPELVQPHGRARVVVLGCEVGGRRSEEPRRFLAGLAAAKARCELEVVRKSTTLCWLRRWRTLMACTAEISFSCPCWNVGVVPQLLAPFQRRLRWWPITSAKWDEWRKLVQFSFPCDFSVDWVTLQFLCCQKKSKNTDSMDLACTCVKHQMRLNVCQSFCVPNTKCALIRASPTAFITVSPNEFFVHTFSQHAQSRHAELAPFAGGTACATHYFQNPAVRFMCESDSCVG